MVLSAPIGLKFFSSKSNNNNSISGTILTNFSDHFTNFIGICNSNNKPKTEYRVSRNFSAANIEKFNDDLSKLRWRNVLSSNDVNVSFDNFWSDFYALFILHFPLKKVKLNRNVHKIQNFITNGILTSRRHKMNYIKKRFLTPLNFTIHSLNTETCIIRSLKLVNRCLLMTISKNSKKTQKKLGIFSKKQPLATKLTTK